MKITVEQITDNDALVLGAKVRRPLSMGVSSWRRFWDGRVDMTNRIQSLKIDRWTAQPFGCTVTRPRSVTYEEWVAFWSIRCTNDLRRAVV